VGSGCVIYGLPLPSRVESEGVAVWVAHSGASTPKGAARMTDVASLPTGLIAEIERLLLLAGDGGNIGSSLEDVDWVSIRIADVEYRQSLLQLPGAPYYVVSMEPAEPHYELGRWLESYLHDAGFLNVYVECAWG
jgi:hypothetical protein